MNPSAISVFGLSLICLVLCSMVALSGVQLPAPQGQTAVTATAASISEAERAQLLVLRRKANALARQIGMQKRRLVKEQKKIPAISGKVTHIEDQLAVLEARVTEARFAHLAGIRQIHSRHA